MFFSLSCTVCSGVWGVICQIVSVFRCLMGSGLLKLQLIVLMTTILYERQTTSLHGHISVNF